MGTMQIGRLIVTESEVRELSETPDGISLKGVETNGAKPIQWARTFQQNVIGLAGAFVPVFFSKKTDWNGFYMVNKSNATLTDWTSIALCEYDVDLIRVGYPNDLDIESRLSGPQSLANDHSAVGERWNAPAIGHAAYMAGSSQPSQVARIGTEGTMKVYRSLALNVNPRWNIPAQLYPIGRCRFIDSNGYERIGNDQSLSPSGWVMSNSMFRITGMASGNTLDIACWDGSTWDTKSWNLRYNGAALGVPRSVNIMHNEYETLVVRLLWDVTPSGRVWADLTLRRGARHVEIYMKSPISTTLGFLRAATEAATSSTGYITATANDAQGNKFTCGSAKTFTADTVNGGISKTTTLSFDGYIGCVVAGTGAQAGDTSAVIFSQFIGAPSERVIGVRV